MPRTLTARAAGLAIVVVAGAVAQAGPGTGPKGAAAPARARCVPAAIADVVLGGPVRIDEIRVVVAEGSPESGAAEVVVQGERADRVLRVQGGSHDLKFFPALTSSAFRVSLSPVFAAARDACVDRIELRRGGTAIVTVVP
jgi:hypothetical protein